MPNYLYFVFLMWLIGFPCCYMSWRENNRAKSLGYFAVFNICIALACIVQGYLSTTPFASFNKTLVVLGLLNLVGGALNARRGLAIKERQAREPRR